MTRTLRDRLKVRSRRRARQRYWSEYDRDSHCCRVCGANRDLEVHHRDGDWLNNEFINLVAICHECHRSIHRRRNTAQRLDEWKASVELLQPHSGVSLATDGGDRA